MADNSTNCDYMSETFDGVVVGWRKQSSRKEPNQARAVEIWKMMRSVIIGIGKIVVGRQVGRYAAYIKAGQKERYSSYVPYTSVIL